ncbi:hypothetical protein SDC9_154212 [bioreactor metagenome]|uniref:Uncharacterized protein n=1 Tax=bioreactor metagenome TaxID=1076179 RepID=A0A645EY35_9ZZZZ
MPLPTFIAFTVSSISKAVFFAASALFAAKFLTSSATTANPFPASPALAASTAAFNASIFVWKAISSIILIILLISLDFIFINSIADIISFILALLSCIFSPASFTTSFALLAFSELLLILSETSSIATVSCSTLAACSDDPCANDCAPIETSFAPDAT